MDKSSADHLGFRMALSVAPDSPQEPKPPEATKETTPLPTRAYAENSGADIDPPVELDLLPNTPILLGLDVNRMPTGSDPAEDAALFSSPSPNSAASSFQMDFFKPNVGDGEKASSRGSDEDDNASTRKKLRLSKEQLAFLEESFKQLSTLNPKQKLALAQQLNLQPRQVEVWFQNRRARTKLKQTEVDCKYLKRRCETLTEENRRLQKEVKELRALKSSNPFYMQLPPTTLTMCPSCESVATAATQTQSKATTVLSLATASRLQHHHPTSKETTD